MANWEDFPEAEPEDPWVAFPKATSRKRKRKRGSRTERNAIPANTKLVDPVATDGDTVRADQGNIRLAGVDVPEAKQMGWDREGNSVPIGTEATRALAGILERGPAVTGEAFGTSFGRTNAPIIVRNDDAGRTLVRYGNALAAPEFIAFDAARSRNYQQDERLARLNGLGMHDTVAQSPAEFRADPNYVPDRETIAQFFDTPTPLEGFRPEVEQRYLHVLATGTADEIMSFVREQGTDMREKELRQWVQWRDDERKAGRNPGVSAIYERGPEVLIDSGDGATGAAVRKFGSGFLAGGLDEAGAVVDTLGGTDGRESIWNSERRVADIWANNQRQNSAILSYDQENHPVASTVGEIAGAVTSGFVIPFGAGARTVPQLAKVGAIYGGLEGGLSTDGTIVDRAKGAIIGAPIGAAANATLGKAIEAVAPHLLTGVRKLRGGADDPAALSTPEQDPWEAFPVAAAATCYPWRRSSEPGG